MADKFFLKDLFKSLIYSHQRLFIIALSVFIGALISSAFLNIYFDIDTKLSHELKAYGANVALSPKKERLISNEKFAELKEKLEARALTPYLFDFLNLGSTSGVVLGTDFKALKITKPFLEIKEGSFSLSDFKEDSAFIGVNLAKSLEAKVGSQIQIYNQSTSKSAKVTIKAILLSNDEFDSLLLVPLKLLQDLSNTGAIHYANAVLYGDFESISAKTQALSDEIVSVKPISSVSLSEALVLDKIKALMFLIVFIVLIIVTTSVNTTLSSIILSRKKEVALRLALGSKEGEIFKLFASECFVVSFLSCVLGAFCGIFLANIFGLLIFNAGIDFRFKAVFFSVLISMIFAAFAAFFPLKKALKINVCENLKGE